MKSERQNAMIDLITRYEIETQEEMMSCLLKEGFKVTQATVSRDLKELKLTKTLTGRGTYKYCVSHGRAHTGNLHLGNAMADSVLHIEHSMNNVVIKTYPGLAQAVASAIDSMNLDGFLGCVAGDDTIIIVTRNTESSEQIGDRIRELVKTV